MQNVRLEKVTLNIGSGEAGDKLERAKTLLERLSSRKPVVTLAHARNPTWRIKKGDPVGAKVTLRGKDAGEFLKKAFTAAENKIKATSFDKGGTFSFGVKEYIDFPGAKYDPQLGMMGFDVCVTLTKPGRRVVLRRIGAGRLPRKQRVTREDAMDYVRSTYQAKIIEPGEEAV